MLETIKNKISYILNIWRNLQKTEGVTNNLYQLPNVKEDIIGDFNIENYEVKIDNNKVEWFTTYRYNRDKIYKTEKSSLPLSWFNKNHLELYDILKHTLFELIIKDKIKIENDLKYYNKRLEQIKKLEETFK